MDHLHRLPPEVVSLIVRHLSTKDLKSLRYATKQWSSPIERRLFSHLRLVPHMGCINAFKELFPESRRATFYHLALDMSCEYIMRRLQDQIQHYETNHPNLEPPVALRLLDKSMLKSITSQRIELDDLLDEFKKVLALLPRLRQVTLYPESYSVRAFYQIPSYYQG